MRADTNVATSDPLVPRFHFIGGKGGVGKTTCAAAFALRAASRQRVLVASTDPSPSLGDAFGVGLGPAPTRITATLDGVEIDAPRVLRRWIADRRASLERIALQGTWLDREDVNRLLGLSLPGIDEVAALLELSRLARHGRYQLIVVDTAPTGHTLRMLSMPETLFGMARVFDQMRQKHRVMVEALRGGFVPEDEDAMIDELAAEARALAGLVRDAQRTRLSWVTLPEPMAIAETKDALVDLRSRGVTVHDLIVNRLTPPRRSKCAHCDARRAFEATALRSLPREPDILPVAASDEEPRGPAALKAIGAQLTAPVFAARHTGRTKVLRYRAFDIPVAQDFSPADFSPAATAPAALKLLLFGGKGGVGKTTCAAATAIALADQHKDRRLLLISTDPAHSLGDVLGMTLSDEERPVRGAGANLLARELDATRVLEGVKREYAAAIDKIFERFTSGGSFDVAHDRSVLHGLIDLAPPGLDELAAIIEISDAVARERPRWDLAVIDTAPTGHALRLLELPSLIHDWTKALMTILLKYQPVTGLGDLGALLLKLSRGLGTLRELLVDPARTHFVVVTRAAALPRAESVRLLKRLATLGIHVPEVVVNAVGRGSCAACRKAAAAEQREISTLRRAVVARKTPRTLVLAATQIPPPHGAVQLRAWRRTGWRIASSEQRTANREPRALLSKH